MLHWHVGIIFNNYSTSAHWIWVGYNHLISNKHKWNNCFIKDTAKYREFFLTLFVKTTNFQLVFNFEQTCTFTIFGERGIICLYTMMAKPIRALELHYSMIQFLIKVRWRHTWAVGPHGWSLFLVSIVWSKPRSIATRLWMGCLSIAGLPPRSMLPVPIYSPGWRETKWNKVPCLRKQRDWRGFNPGPPDPEFEVLTARPHTPPQ